MVEFTPKPGVHAAFDAIIRDHAAYAALIEARSIKVCAL